MLMGPYNDSLLAKSVCASVYVGLAKTKKSSHQWWEIQIMEENIIDAWSILHDRRDNQWALKHAFTNTVLKLVFIVDAT